MSRGDGRTIVDGRRQTCDNSIPLKSEPPRAAKLSASSFFDFLFPNFLLGVSGEEVVVAKDAVPEGHGGGENGEHLGDGTETFFENGVDKSPIRGDVQGGLADDQSFEPPKFADAFYNDPGCYGPDKKLIFHFNQRK